MAIYEFPPVESADESGLLAVGGDLEVESLILAYSKGIFPWPFDSKLLAWFSPPERAILFLDKAHISKSLAKKAKRNPYEILINRNTPEVIKRCSTSTNRKAQIGTWITKDMISAYVEFHRAGYCHSIECYRDSELVGGLYGVTLGAYFSGESMFHLEPDTSKLCLLHLITHLRERGFRWLDCQVMTPLLASFGAHEVTRKYFLLLLRQALKTKDVSFLPEC